MPTLEELLDQVRNKLERRFRLELVEDKCDDGHVCWVIRPIGDTDVGLVIAHIDEDFGVEYMVALVKLLTPKFFSFMAIGGFYSDWNYLDAISYLGKECIQIRGTQMGHGESVYWIHSTQNVYIPH